MSGPRRPSAQTANAMPLRTMPAIDTAVQQRGEYERGDGGHDVDGLPAGGAGDQAADRAGDEDADEQARHDGTGHTAAVVVVGEVAPERREELP